MKANFKKVAVAVAMATALAAGAVGVAASSTSDDAGNSLRKAVSAQRGNSL